MPKRFWPVLLIATSLLLSCGEGERVPEPAGGAGSQAAQGEADQATSGELTATPVKKRPVAAVDDKPVSGDDPSLVVGARVAHLSSLGSREALRLALRLLLEHRDHVGPPSAEQSATPAVIEAVVDGLIAWDGVALAHGEPEWAQGDLPLLQRWAPQDPRLTTLATQLENTIKVQNLLAEATRAEVKGRLLEPEARSAVTALRAVLSIQRDNSQALRALARIERRLIEAALGQAEAKDFKQAQVLLAQAGRVRDSSTAVQNAATRVMEIREREIRYQQSRIEAELAVGHLDAATELLPGLEAIALDERAGQAARAAIERVRMYGAYEAGALFTDRLSHGGQGPGMVVIPAGRFEMGSPRGEENRRSSEGRQHEVRFARGFAMARTEVTVAQFRAFIEATDYRTTAQRERHSLVYDERGGALVDKRRVNWKHDYAGKKAADDLPVLHVSWDDALAYAQWLASETGMAYRLPSEAEFEYALRAGSRSMYPWGEAAPEARVENLTGALDSSPSNRRWANAFADYRDGFWGAAPVASFASNAFGLNDINGNVSEWVSDCWHDSYARAPKDGSAWVNPGCKERVVRGASWASSPAQARSAFRAGMAASTSSARIGFRVARDL